MTLEDECLTDGQSHDILAQLQECVAEHFDVPVEHSTFQLETAAHRDQEQLHH